MFLTAITTQSNRSVALVGGNHHAQSFPAPAGFTQDNLAVELSIN